MRQVNKVCHADRNAHGQCSRNGLAVLTAVCFLNQQRAERDTNKGGNNLAEDNVCRLMVRAKVR